MAEAWRAQALAALRQGAAQLDVPLSAVQQEKLLDYVALLHKWNRAYNLTAVRQPEEMVVRHILDTLAVSPHLRGERWLDVGTGAGVPGVVLAILWPHRTFDLVDSNLKKARFVRQAARALTLRNVRVVQQRVERWKSEGCYDGIVSRAFSSLAQFVGLTEPLLCPGGRWWAMKGHGEKEVAQLPPNVAVERVIEVGVPRLEARRTLVVLHKKEAE